MKNPRVRVRINLAMGLLLGLSAGCGSGGSGVDSNPSQDAYKEASLGEVGDLLRNRKTENAPPPSKASDLARYRAGWPGGFKSVEEGSIVVIWGAPLQDGATDKVIAYEKQVPESGGYVLMQDGMTIKKMTADEFKTASKAGKN
jgi:hypothetical protein